MILCLFLLAASEDASQTHGEEFEAEVSIGTDIPDHEQVDEYQDQDTLLDTNQQIHQDSPTNDSGKPQFLIILFPQVHS